MNPTPEYQPELWCQPLCESKTYMLGLVYYRGGTNHLDALFLNDSQNLADGPSESVRTLNFSVLVSRLLLKSLNVWTRTYFRGGTK